MKASGHKTTTFGNGKTIGAVEKALRIANADISIPNSNDDFFETVCSAIPAFNGAKLRAACNGGGATVDLILWLLSDRPLSSGDRRSLANLLAGELHSTGRKPLKAAKIRTYVDLLDETRARIKRREFSGADKLHEAAKCAAKDPRAGRRRASTIERDMGRNRSYWGL